VIAHEAIYDDLVARLIDGGAHLCDDQQKDALRALMWPDGGAVPAMAVVAKSAAHIAELAGFQVTQDCPMLLAEETGTGRDHPFSGEKLSVVLAIYRYEGDIDAAAELVNDITDYQGLGHTCGIHTRSDANVERLAMTTRTARVLVNQNLNEGAGSPRNGLPFTLSLSCGTWGGNITTENVNARHFINLTWVSRPIEPRAVTEADLFAAHWRAHGR
jgi:sulfoacetaldehyde dehydrogenase